MNRGAAFDRVMGWVRTAYPDGVPAEDHAGLLGVLDNYLSGDQLGAVASLMGSAKPTEDPTEIARVTATLVAGGWPLASPEDDDDPTLVHRALSSVVSWLRAGYPEGVPPPDYVPLVAILQRRLTKRELKAVTKELKANGLLSPDVSEIEDAIRHQTREPASQADLTRVTEHLRKKGWPVELD